MKQVILLNYYHHVDNLDYYIPSGPLGIEWNYSIIYILYILQSKSMQMQLYLVSKYSQLGKYLPTLHSGIVHSGIGCTY